jgi:hypothetical protein
MKWFLTKSMKSICTQKPILRSASPQPLPQEGGANLVNVIYLPLSLLGEGGWGMRQQEKEWLFNSW